jgi:hypothetical protein
LVLATLPARRQCFSLGALAKCSFWSAVTICTRACLDTLAQRIEKTANIEVLCNTTVRRMSGDRYLHAVDAMGQKVGLALLC